MAARALEIRGNLQHDYADVFTPEAVAALEASGWAGCRSAKP